MSATGNKVSTKAARPLDPRVSQCYQEASTSRWDLRPLFQSFLEDRPTDTLLAVQNRDLLISWDIKAIHYLRQCLRAWVINRVPGDAIGAFLVIVLYEQDFHLDYRLTALVRDGQTQLHIARRILAFYQLRDLLGDPIWDNIAVYPEEYDPKSPRLGVSIAEDTAAVTEGFQCLISTPQPADPRWPHFLGSLSDKEFEDLVNQLGESQYTNGKSSPPLFTGADKRDLPILQAFRRFTIHKDDLWADLPLLQYGPVQDRHTPQTDRSQNSPLPAKPLLPLPPSPSLSPRVSSSARVSTRNAERTARTESVDRVHSKMVTIRKSKSKTDLNSSSGEKSPINVDKPLPHVPYYVVTDDDIPPAVPRPLKKTGWEDLRKTRNREASIIGASGSGGGGNRKASIIGGSDGTYYTFF
ncbi:hypothetical protein N7457_003289 [Penicillium paradoxum]|uniref:uncharacterized protein n=1 Tax=Penicillium paradoxum TaxID=176176 RepID=UPI002547E25B|nr:uncharacterized protein N7457_003289 [Penicillium paradoxum]KAJ5788299.1 hypothetical protein N7457_003289 [Penicillium paradoxum]